MSMNLLFYLEKNKVDRKDWKKIAKDVLITGYFYIRKSLNFLFSVNET